MEDDRQDGGEESSGSSDGKEDDTQVVVVSKEANGVERMDVEESVEVESGVGNQKKSKKKLKVGTSEAKTPLKADSSGKVGTPTMVSRRYTGSATASAMPPNDWKKLFQLYQKGQRRRNGKKE